MPAPIEDVQDVRRLVKQLGIKVETVEDLERVLMALNSSYNPDANRVKTIRAISTTAISVSLSAAGIVSFFALANPNMAQLTAMGFPLFAALIVMWAMAGAVSLLAVFLGLLWLRQPAQRALNQPGPAAPDRLPALPGSEHITTPDNVKFPREYS